MENLGEVEWFDERAEIAHMEIAKALGADPAEPATFLVLDTGSLPAWKEKRAEIDALPALSQEQLDAVEGWLNEEWAKENVEKYINQDGDVVREEKWTNEQATFTLMHLSGLYWDGSDESSEEQVDRVLINVVFPDGSERDFEKFWNDFVGSYIPDSWLVEAVGFKGPDWKTVTSTSSTYRVKK